jgi:predicted ATPase/class 3 adenylate cyclase
MLPGVRADLPTGTVTFLFTDVEGSTRLLHELGAEAYAEALGEHRRVIREACAALGGAEVDTQGDAFFFAFPTAPAAVSAAAAFTDGLAAGPIRVRVGLHTGTPLLTEEGYVGGDVHRAARIAAAGHGGQVLVSATTAPLLELELQDLGEHRFKDLAAPERVYQLGGGEFPPLASLYRTNLPIPATPFLGREHELVEVVELLSRLEIRLLTLTGPGGTGKTRLALQAAAEAADAFPDGVWWVALALLRDPRRALPALAEALAIEEKPGRDLAEVVALALAGRRMLVLLDNVEHLLPTIADDVATLRDIGGPTILVTSRERLQLQGEHAHPVPGLEESDAIELFVTRARAAGQEVAVDDIVRELCARLDYLPLALELAAARAVVFPPAQLLGRLTERLDLFRAPRDADPRQQTLRATIEWSYELLAATEQELFRSLAVFVGGSTYETAEAVCGASPDILQSLIDKSLLRRRDTPLGARYWMLETIREFASEKLEESGAAEDLRRRHAEHYLALGESLGLTMENLERVGSQRHDIAIAEQDNFRTAIDWAVDADIELAVGIAFSLENFWVTHDPQEGIRRFDRFLERSDDLPVELRAAANRCRGNVTMMVGDRPGGRVYYAAALASYGDAGDEVGALLMEHRLLVNEGLDDLEERRKGLEALLVRFRELELPSGEVQVLWALAAVEWREGRLDRAVELLQAAAARAGSLGFAWTEQGVREALARLSLELDRTDEARAEGLRALDIARRAGDRLAMVSTLALLAATAALRGEREHAGVLWGAIEAERERRPFSSWVLEDRSEVEMLLVLDDAEFVQGRERGHPLSLDEAVEYALASID